MRWGVGIVLAVVMLGVQPAGAAAPNIELGVGKAVFWPGTGPVTGRVSDASACDAATCPTWTLQLGGGGHRLRVAIDTPSREDTFRVDVIDAGGEVAASAATDNQFNAEAFVADPAAGKWTVRVVPQAVADAPFRMRAKLESAPATRPAGKVALLPNLKTVPPYEFGFIAPANPLNGLYPPDTVNPPLDVAGIHPLSCAPDESAPKELGGSGAQSCLRLTSGPINAGEGPFDMRFKLVDDVVGGEAELNTLRGPITQAIHYSDDSVEMRSAGTYSFHTTHGHFHTDQILTYELFAVTDATTGGIRPAGEGTKSGFCPADQLFGEWRQFTQEPRGTFGEGDSAAGGNCFSPDDGFIGLTAGWGDVYRWQRPGQYVEFAGNTDGLYVVRTTADKSNHILETNENDNTAFAYIRVTGDQVELLERGQGSDPWDPHKLVFLGAGPASQDDVGGELAVLGQTFEAPAAEAGRAAPVSTLPATGGPGWPPWWGAGCVLAAVLVANSIRRLENMVAWRRTPTRR